MLARRSLLAFARGGRRTFAMASNTQSQTPVEDVMREKIQTSLSPTHLEIHNDSHLHSHHKAMQGVTSQETHFRVVITSEKFGGKTTIARHKMVYALLDEEMKRDGGIHALQMRLKTAEEARKVEDAATAPAAVS